MWRNLFVLAGCVPIVVLLGALQFERWRRKAAGTRLPVIERLLRPAGHTLSRRIEDLGDDFMGWVLGAYLAALMAVGTWRLAPIDVVGEYVWLVVFGAGAGVCTVVAWRNALRIRMFRLGLLGEQIMGELLQILAAEGYRIFHDVPGDGKWNVDHVLVGPAGVFAIETKCRTKRPGPGGRPAHECSFDGEAIRFPRYADFKTPGQARRNAEWIAGMLSKATGEAVTAQPVVALPGWFVPPPKGDWNLKVLSGKQVPGSITGQPGILSAKAIQQIAYQLDQRCRDVEF